MSGIRKAKRCNTCALRKITCDQKSPSCSQCLLTGRACGGYHQQTVFVQHDFGGKAPRRKRQGAKKSTTYFKTPEKEYASKSLKAGAGPAIKFQVAPSEKVCPTEQNYLISIIIDRFTPAQEIQLVNNTDGTAACLNSRVCGAWVTLLPNIIARPSSHLDVLQCAIRSLAYSILGNVSQALEAYGETLRSFKDLLSVAGEDTIEELLTVMLCLSISEVLLGTEHNGWSAHTDGISKLVQGRGPGSFKSGTLHQLFTSFRVFMVLGAIQQRKETFLDEPRWKTTPFVSESKSFMQSLLDQVSGLPTLLQRLDLISGSGLGWQNNVIATLYNDYISQIISLESWGAELMLNSESNLLWWPVALSSNADTTFSIQYNFANILIANTISHYWGFLLILQISIETLRSISSKQGLENACPTKHSVEFLQDKTVEVANDICRGMDYHLQPEMKLYGPAATLFPINIALQVF